MFSPLCMNATAGRYMWGIVVGGLVMVSGAAAATDGGLAIARTVAMQEIEYLRKSYARATDQIGQNTAGSIAEGRATYHRIFTDDVTIRVKDDGVPADDTVGIIGAQQMKKVVDYIEGKIDGSIEEGRLALDYLRNSNPE